MKAVGYASRFFVIFYPVPQNANFGAFFYLKLKDVAKRAAKKL